MIIDFGALFKDTLLAGVPLLAFVLALTQWIKDVASLEGKAVRVCAMAVGVVFGFGYQLQLAVPTDFGGWFTVVVFGILLGLGASGIYDAATTAFAAAKA